MLASLLIRSLALVLSSRSIVRDLEADPLHSRVILPMFVENLTQEKLAVCNASDRDRIV